MAGEVKDAMIEVVKKIPFGKVTNYGEIAKIVSGVIGHAISAQMIGWQLSGLVSGGEDFVPWWRVINKQGFVSTLKKGDKGWKQIAALASERVVVTDGYVDLKTYWVSSGELR